MEKISLRRIDETNFIECFNLKLGPGQERYVSHPIRSLAQAYVYYKQCTPFGIYCGSTMVGYVMVIYDYDEKSYNIWHFMIDEKYQGKGYSKLALKCVLEYIAKQPFGKSKLVLLTCNPESEIAYKLYKKAGFSENGNKDEDEVEMQLMLE